VDIFSLNSILLGQSRVFTTFGGDLFMWSVKGDINAGRGSKSTAVYQPPRRVYDEYGNVTLSPPTQNTGAGIATLAPIPEIPPGDVDLIAPLGTIDAGEAGIRVSGDVNLAALQVLNAANIEVKGDATGIPQAAVVDTGALTAASSAASAVIAQAAALAERTRPQMVREIPAIVTVRFLGFGE
ncbi:filamentous hemagglutinin family protein, partial [Sandaracinobacter sp. RS1-74]|uniref:filamentous haemagglutinin family protein n=1 Tax=Sandaracinobacteroides sayramensis TaxID=2913411 RepID=UPI001EDB0080